MIISTTYGRNRNRNLVMASTRFIEVKTLL